MTRLLRRWSACTHQGTLALERLLQMLCHGVCKNDVWLYPAIVSVRRSGERSTVEAGQVTIPKIDPCGPEAESGAIAPLRMTAAATSPSTHKITAGHAKKL